MSRYFFYLLCIIFFSLFSCSSPTSTEQNTSQKKVDRDASAKHKADKEVNETQQHPGKLVYDTYCLACHQSDGHGVPTMHPPVAENPTVTGDKQKLIEIILEGQSGRIIVNGEVYNGIMPPQKHLTDKQIADLLTYIRSNFNNEAGPVTEDEVSGVRKDLNL